MSGIMQIVSSAPKLLPGSGAATIAIGIAVIIYGVATINRNALVSALSFGFVGNGVVLYGTATALNPAKPFSFWLLGTVPGMSWALVAFLGLVGGTLVLVITDTAAARAMQSTESAPEPAKPLVDMVFIAPTVNGNTLRLRTFMRADAAKANQWPSAGGKQLRTDYLDIHGSAYGEQQGERTVAFLAGQHPVEIGHYLVGNSARHQYATV